MKKVKTPTKRESQPVTTWEQEQFELLYKDTPASEIPPYSVAEAFNVLLYGEYAEIRPGTKLWSAANLPSLAEETEFSAGGQPLSPLPSIPGRQNYEAIKIGRIITKSVGQDFTDADVFSYFVWPDGVNEVIVEVLNKDEIKVLTDEEHSDATELSPGKLRGPINNLYWYDKEEKLFLHIDNRLFYTDYRIQSFTEVICTSRAQPTNEKSSMDEDKEMVYLFTTDGIFQADTETSPMLMYKINEDTPSNSIPSVAETDLRNFGRRYLFSLANLAGTGVRNRGTAGATIKKESGTNKIEKQKNGEYNDYKEFFFRHEPNSVGTGDTYQCTYNIAALDLLRFTELADASFGIQTNVGGVGACAIEVLASLIGLKSWKEVAKKFEETILGSCPQAQLLEFRWLEADNAFLLNPSAIDGSHALGAGMIAGGNGTPIGTVSIYVGAVNYEFAAAQWNLGSAAFKVPSDGWQYTHFSLYSTNNLNDDGTNKNLFIWNEDIPIAKAFTTESLTAAGVLTASEGVFEIMDVGSKIFFEDGSFHTIKVYISKTQVRVRYVNEVPGRAFVYDANVSAKGKRAACIGEGDVATMYQRDGLVKWKSGDKFKPEDVRKTLFWADGGYSHITEYINPKQVKVAETDRHDSQGVTWNPVQRGFNDNTEEGVLAGRAKVYPLQQRFWAELPGGPLGKVNNGFMFVAKDQGEEINYSQMPIDYEYLAGHHSIATNASQKHNLKDSIVEMGEFTDRLILYCANSTWRILTNTSIPVEVPDVGEIVFIITGVAVVDTDIGLKSRGSLRTLKQGKQIMITSEPGIRIFDAYQYGDNLALDSKGKSHLLKYLSEMQNVMSSGFDDVYGYMLWGTTENMTNDKVFDYDKCYKLGIFSDNSQGWGEIGGPGWVIPEPRVGMIKLFTDKEQPFTVIFDARRGLPYLMATRDGPDDSNIKKVWRDKVGINGYDVGYEIPWILGLKEHRGEREDQQLVHLTSYAHVRPQDESNKGAAGHDANGYRDALEITLKGYVNGNLAESVLTANIPYKGDLVFDKKLQDNRIQLKLFGTASELRIVNVTTDYEQIDARGPSSQRFMSEALEQAEYAEPVFWVCRDRLTNLATNAEPTGSIFGFSTGPDGGQTAMIFVAASSLTYPIGNITGDFTMQFGLSGITATTEMFRIGDMIVSVNVSGNEYELSFNDGVNTYTQDLAWNGAGWVYLKLTRGGEYLIVSENGSQLMKIMLTTIETITGDLVISGAKTFFDPRIYESIISENAFSYYYRNVTTQNGEAILCPQ